jgi:chromosomal replication initiation ATPase DnaA
MIKDKFFERKRHIEVPESKRLAPSADRIIHAVCEHYNMDKAHLFKTKRGTRNEARSMAIYLLRRLRGESLVNIGKAFNIDSYSTVSSIIGRFKVRIPTDRKLSYKVEQLRESLMRQRQT